MSILKIHESHFISMAQNSNTLGWDPSIVFNLIGEIMPVPVPAAEPANAVDLYLFTFSRILKVYSSSTKWLRSDLE